MNSKRMPKIKAVIATGLASLMSSTGVTAQTDPGVRGGPPGAGNIIAGTNYNETASFLEGKLRAEELEATCDGCSDVTPGSDTGQDPNLATITSSAGLGARHNADQCTVCHTQPAIGGSGGFLVPNPKADPSNFRRPENPMFDLIPHRNWQTNTVPSFITQFGPIREARFKFLRDSNGNLTTTRDGGVHQLFTIVGRDTNTDGRDDPIVAGCTNAVLPQTDFEREVAENNISFRIPLQMFGMGLIDSIQDKEILKRHDTTAAQREVVGIEGIPNRSGNDGTITRFGWKAQNKSLTVFAGEAYNVENGVTNELFPQPTSGINECNGPQKPHPNDITRTADTDEDNESFFNPMHILADWMQFSLFMRFLDGPQRAPVNASITRGEKLFENTDPNSANFVGCALCHTPEMKTAATMGGSGALENKTVSLYSDLLVHHMGNGLMDDIVQGAAGPDQFRTTPLWGLGQRIFFLHDGRTNDLLTAIQAHSSANSEANAVITSFNALSNSQKQDILNFLRSL